MKIKLVLWCALSISLIGIGVWIHTLYKRYDFLYNNYIENLNLTFHKAVLLETKKRLTDFKVPFIKKDDLPGAKKAEHASFTGSSGTVYFKRTDDYEALSIEEKENLFLQTFLAWDRKYINLADLNEIWQEQLMDRRITGLETGIKYRHRDFADTVYSDRDSLFFVNSSRIDWYVTGIFKEIDLQGHYNFSYVSLFNYAKNEILVFLFIGIILILFFIVCCVLLVRNRRMILKSSAGILAEKKSVYRCSA